MFVGSLNTHVESSDRLRAVIEWDMLWRQLAVAFFIVLNQNLLRATEKTRKASVTRVPAQNGVRTRNIPNSRQKPY
jgi:hypothetical protein